MKLLTLFFLYLSIFSFAQNQKKIDSLENVLRTTKIDTVKINALIEKGTSYFSTQIDSSLQYFKLALEISNKINSQKFQAFSYQNIGYYHYYKGDFNTALEFLKKSSELYGQVKDIKTQTRLTMNIGLIYYNLADYKKSLNLYMATLKKFEDLKDEKSVASVLNNMGLVYYKLKSFDQALKYFNKALLIRKNLQNENAINETLGNIALVYESQNKYPDALKIYEQVINYFVKNSDFNKAGKCYNNMSLLLQKMKDYPKAIEFLNKSLRIAENIGDLNEIALTKGNISYNYILIAEQADTKPIKELNYKLAIEFALQALQIASDLKSKELIVDQSERLFKAFAGIDDFKRAYYYSYLYIVGKDSLMNSELTKTIQDMEAKYQNEKKQKEIELLNKEKDLKNTKIRQQKYTIYGFIAGFVVVLFFSVIIVWFYRQKKKANELLKQQYCEILEKNEEIKQQNEEIQAQAEQLELTNKELETLSIAASETDNSIVIADKSGNIEWINAGFTKLFGYTLEEFKQNVGSNIFDTSNNPNIEVIKDICIHKKESVCYAVKNITKEGKQLWLQTTITPIKDYENNITKLVAIDSDISKLKEAEEEIVTKSELLLKANTELNQKNIQIMDSICYASLIQEAILPAKKYITSVFTDSFVFYKPKDVVSGDFYWLSLKNNFIYFAVVDCTGHGVPGALMSMIGNSILNEIVSSQEILTPAEILQQLNEKVIQALKQGGDNLDSEGDGMDISLCRIDKTNKEILFAGAQHSAYIMINQELISVKGERYSIGSLLNSRLKITYSNQKISYIEDVEIYMFSDGIVDQRGGSEFEKYQHERLEELLKNNHHLKMAEQLHIIDSSFSEWKAGFSQTDDVTLIGFKI